MSTSHEPAMADGLRERNAVPLTDNTTYATKQHVKAEVEKEKSQKTFGRTPDGTSTCCPANCCHPGPDECVRLPTE